MFETIPQIHQLMQLIDKCNLQEKVFEHIMRRCCHVISHNDDITGDEYAKFRNVLGLNDSETKMITSTLNSILQECIYYVAKPNLVLEGLQNGGMKLEFATVIAQTWSSSARTMVDNVRKEKALTAKIPPANQLKNIDYSITVRLGTNPDERTHRHLEPTAIFNLGGNTKQEDDQPIVFEADYNSLYDLYQNLECIQEKLDELKA